MWIKQTPDKPLFSDLLWSRPENRLHAGKLLVIGGNLHGFSGVATAYREAERAGAGTTRVLLPSALQKTVGGFIPNAEFSPSTPSGSFALKSLSAWIEQAAWADGVLIAGDIGRNSETAIILEQFLTKHSGQVTLTKDSIELLTADTPVLDRPETCLVVSFAQLQKLAKQSGFSMPFVFSMTILNFIETLEAFTKQHGVSIVTKHYRQFFVAYQGTVSSTPATDDSDIWRSATAAHASVWWLQNPDKALEAITTSLIAK